MESRIMSAAPDSGLQNPRRLSFRLCRAIALALTIVHLGIVLAQVPARRAQRIEDASGRLLKQMWNAYAQAGGTQQGLNQAYAAVDSHGGDLGAAQQTMKSGVRNAVYTLPDPSPPRQWVL